MFEGRMAGKGYANHIGLAVRDSSISIPTVADNGLELIVSHDNLMTYLNKELSRPNNTACLKACKDVASGLYGLRRGNMITCKPQFVRVFDIQEDFAIVRLVNLSMAVVDDRKSEAQPCRLQKRKDSGKPYYRCYGQEEQ